MKQTIQLIINGMQIQGLNLETRNCQRRSRLILALLCLILGALVLIPDVARAQTSASMNNVSGNWSAAATWSTGIPPDGGGAVTGTASLSAARTLTVDTTSRTISQFDGSTLNGKTLTISSSGGAFLLFSNAVGTCFTRASTGVLIYNVVIAGTNSIEFRGKNSGASPVVSLGAVNTYSGDTVIVPVINGGADHTLRVGIANAVPHGVGKGNVVFGPTTTVNSYATFNLQTFDTTINGLNGSFGTVSSTSAAGTTTLTVGDADASGSFGGVINNGATRILALTKIGLGNQILSGISTYSGPTTISSGRLTFVTGGSCASSAVSIGANATNNISYAGSDTTWTAKSLSCTAGGCALNFDLGANQPSATVAPLTLSQGVTFSATPTINIDGPTIGNGTYPLITYTTANAGSMPVTATLPGGGTGILQDNTTTKTIELVVGGGVFPPNIHWATGSGTWDTSLFSWKGIPGNSTNYVDGVPVQFGDTDAITNPIVTLNTTVAPASVVFSAASHAYTLTGSGNITGGVTLSKSGSSSVTLDVANTHTGGSQLLAGTLNLKNAAALGDVSGTVTLSGGTLDNTSGGPLTLLNYPQAWNGNFTFNGSANLDMGVGTVVMSASRTVTVNAGNLRVGGIISGSGFNLVKSGAGTLTLDDAVNLSLGSMTVSNGTLILSATNTHVGDTRITAGSLIVSNTWALQKSALNLDPTDSGTWSFTTLTQAVLGSLKGSRALGLTNATGAALELRVGNKNTSSNGESYGGTMSGPGALTKVGTGNWQLGAGGGGSGTYAGDTTVIAGSLRVGASNVLPHGAGKGNLVVYAPGAFDELDRSSIIVNGLFGDGFVNSSDRGGNGGLATFTVGDNNATATFTGVIENTGSANPGVITLVKIGTGTQTLTGVNTYSGTTTVNGGALLVNSPGSLPATAVTVNSSGTFGGSGTINGSVTVNAGGTISAGDGLGTLTLMAGLDMSAGGTNSWELGALKDDLDGTPGTDFDQIVMTGGAPVLGGSSAVSIHFTGTATAPNGSEPFWQTTHNWTIISASGATNAFPVVKNGDFPVGYFSTSAQAGGVILTYTPGIRLTPVSSFSITQGPGSSLTLSYSGGAGTQFVLLQTNNVAAPLSLWTRIKTNSAASGTFTVTPGADPREFYSIKSE